jgi:hypothetical protein
MVGLSRRSRQETIVRCLNMRRTSLIEVERAADAEGNDQHLDAGSA